MTWEKVVIEDGKATAYHNGQPLAKADEAALVGYQPVMAGLFPPGLRWISANWKTLIIERPPAYQQIAYDAAYRASAKDHRMYRIPIPWQIYVVQFHQSLDHYPSLSTFVRPEPLREATDPLYIYPLANVGEGGGVCMHVETQWPPFMKTNPTLAERAFFMINAMWMSGFNHNMGNIIQQTSRHAKEFQPEVSGTDFQVLERLEHHTVEEVLHWTFPKAPNTLTAFMSPNEISYHDRGVTPGQKFVDELATKVYGARR